MSVDLNGIKLNEWRDNPNVSVQIAERIEKSVWEESLWDTLIGTGENRD